MTYISWALACEGNSDHAYFDILVPRLLEELARTRGVRNLTIPDQPAVRLGKNGRSVAEISKEACAEAAAFHLVFLHADVGGRAQEQSLEQRTEAYRNTIYEQCGFPRIRCVVIAPRHETEAWLLADPNAVTGALGYAGHPTDLGLPNTAREAESLIDPKRKLNEVVTAVRGRRRGNRHDQIIPAIAIRQDLTRLRGAESFKPFEAATIDALRDLACID